MDQIRVVSLVPSWTETLLECDVSVVGRSRFCLEPQEKVSQIPIVGGTKDLDWQKVVACRPNFLILDQEENPKWMFDESPCPTIVTHVTNLESATQGVLRLFQHLQAPRLRAHWERWKLLQNLKISNSGRDRSIMELPGVIEWIRIPDQNIDSIIYVIWKNPWMCIRSDTFIGDVLKNLGYNNHLKNSEDRVPNIFTKKYPEFDLQDIDATRTLLLFSSEPFPFERSKELLKGLPFASALVDGASYSWFGSRTLSFLERHV